MTAQFQVRHDLREVERQQFLHGLESDNNAVFDEEIDAISRIKRNVPVGYWEPHLMPELQSVRAKLISQARVVGALEAAGANCGVNLDCCADDSFSRRVVVHSGYSSASSASSAVESSMTRSRMQAPV